MNKYRLTILTEILRYVFIPDMLKGVHIYRSDQSIG
jgi:hypothetical protein